MIQHQLPSEYSENVGETQGFNYNGHNNTSLVNAVPSRRIHVDGVAAGGTVPEVAILQPKVNQHIVTKKHLKYLDTCWDAWNEADTDFDPRMQGLGNECSFEGTADADKIFNPNMSVKNYEFNFNLMSALFSQEKYLPLLFTNAGIDIELHLESGSRIGATTTYSAALQTSSGAAGNHTYTNPQKTLVTNSAVTNVKYQITDFKYIANLIDLDQEFNMRMRQMMNYKK